MLKRREVLAGRCYVNESEQVAREITEEVDARSIRFTAYDLTTGAPLGAPNRPGSKAEIVRWADREALGAEAARLERPEAQARFAGEEALRLDPLLPNDLFDQILVEQLRQTNKFVNR
jgi:hypothetical protein